MNEKVKTLFQSIRYATISTIDKDGKPWAAPVWYVSDIDNTIYWWSPLDAQHSKNIAHNPDIYITIFDSTAPEGDGFGLYLQAEARITTDNELDLAISLYNQTTKIFKLNRENCTGNAPTRIYKATVSQRWVNDGIEQDGFYIDQRVQL
jgi:predicted pyridoxine 5'-phosphate oxidase superfamily flavin-nucleotide-binding protein